MNVFHSPQTQVKVYLKFLSERISLCDFDSLRTEAGFLPPNNFPLKTVIQVLAATQFPTENLYEYQWAIYECNFDHVRQLSAWMKAYVASLFIYCNKKQQWGTTVESDYYYLVLEATLDSQKNAKELTTVFLLFIEWLCDWVDGDVGYDDYYCLLSWALLRRLSGTTEHKCFRKVIDLLMAKHYSKEELAFLTVSDRGIDAWYELHKRIPCPTKALSEDFERIIRGAS